MTSLQHFSSTGRPVESSLIDPAVCFSFIQGRRIDCSGRPMKTPTWLTSKNLISRNVVSNATAVLRRLAMYSAGGRRPEIGLFRCRLSAQRQICLLFCRCRLTVASRRKQLSQACRGIVVAWRYALISGLLAHCYTGLALSRAWVGMGRLVHALIFFTIARLKKLMLKLYWITPAAYWIRFFFNFCLSRVRLFMQCV